MEIEGGERRRGTLTPYLRTYNLRALDLNTSMENDDGERGRKTTMENPRSLMETFRANFNVEEYVPTMDWETYRRFIVDLRIGLGVRNMFLLVLVPWENPPIQGLDIELQTATLYLNDGWLELGSHASNVDDGQLPPPCEDDVGDGQLSPVDDGQPSPLREEEVDDGHPSPLREEVDDISRARNAPPKRLLQVFSVRFMSRDEQYQGHLYGEIKVVDNVRRNHHIYNRNRKNSEFISPGAFALLTGPTQVVLAYDCFDIEVALVYEYNHCPLDDEVFSELLSWHYGRKYDTLFFEEVKGMLGSVILCYVALRNAVEATLEVALINRGDEEENPATLYGKLTARNSNFLDPSAESALFQRTLAEDIVVRPGQLIPLSRSLVAVPLDSYLIVEAELWGSFNKNEIARGIAEFPAQPFGTSEKTISGEYSQIKVKVTWFTGVF